MGEQTSAKPRIRSYRDLRVYGSAEDGAMALYHLSRAFPPEERFSLTSQIRRSSRSVCANVAEAWQKRRYPLAFTAKLTDAAAEAEETCVWISFACRCGFMSPETAADLSDRYNDIVGMLVRMATRPGDWRTP